MQPKRKRPFYAAGIIERHDNHILIALPAREDLASRLWQFPRGPVGEDESPEAGMRRYCRDAIGLTVEIVVGQPPILAEIDGQECELRYFFCGVVSGEAEPGPYQEIRWVSHVHLREYEFDTASQPVVDWALRTHG